MLSVNSQPKQTVNKWDHIERNRRGPTPIYHSFKIASLHVINHRHGQLSCVKATLQSHETTNCVNIGSIVVIVNSQPCHKVQNMFRHGQAFQVIS